MSNYQGLDLILAEMLSEVTQKLKTSIRVERVIIFLLDQENDELWSLLGREINNLREIRIPVHRGIADEVSSFKKNLNIPFPHEEPRSSSVITQEEAGYRTYNFLYFPLLNSQGDFIGIAQLLNKLKYQNNPKEPLSERIDLRGFTQEDEKKFAQASAALIPTLERCQSLYAEIKKQRAVVALLKATHTISQGGLDLDATLKLIMDEAKELMNADRSTLWLVDRESPTPTPWENPSSSGVAPERRRANAEHRSADTPEITVASLALALTPTDTLHERRNLWTKIFRGDGSWRELRVPIGVGFAGKVAESGEPLNIPFDLYDHPYSEKIKKFDQKTGYRTCSLLCMPVFNADNELIGVMQLVNKRKLGNFPEYNPDDWPVPPEVFQASFSPAAEKLMSAFNVQVAVALQNAKLFETLKQQEQIQGELFRCLPNGIISTDKAGCIIDINERAKQLLNVSEDDKLKGRWIGELIQIKDGKFVKGLQAALEGKDKKSCKQYYPNQTLISGEKEQSIHLSINAIASATDANNIYGVLVVMDEITDDKHLKSPIDGFTTQDFAEEFHKDGDGRLLTKKDVSVLFSHIHSYTSLIEGMETEEVVASVNDYFERIVDAVFRYQGTLDKYIGDGLMAVFGSPLPLEDHAWCAVQSAIEIRHRLAEFNAHRQAQNQEPIRIGIGINSDQVISGNIGSSKRIEFTAIGEGVNLASRLEAASRQYGCDIIISETTYRQCADQIWVRELDRIYARDKNQPVAIYEVVGLRSEPISEQKQQLIDRYHKGRQLYLEQQFALAMSQFALVLAIDGGDKAAVLHMQRCLHWLQSPPPEDWDGVWTLKRG